MELFEKHLTHWSDNFLRSRPIFNKIMIILEIEPFLLSHSRTLPEIFNEDRAFIDNLTNRVAVEAVINEELQHDLAELRSKVVNDFVDNRASLNSKKREFCGHLINCLKRQMQCCGFYVQEAELGKHALNSLLAGTRSLEENIVTVALAVAFSGMSATELNGGRTAHSRFKIPLQIHETSSLNIPYQSALARLIRVSKVIAWGEVPMINRFSLEALDCCFKDLLDADILFVGKSIVLAGDFRSVNFGYSNWNKVILIIFTSINNFFRP